MEDQVPARSPTSTPSSPGPLPGANREWIGGRITTLLAHYWRTDDPPELIAEILADWMDVLEPFPGPAIEHACKTYLQSQPSRKPTPADIRNRAAAWVDQRKPRAPALPPPPPPKRDVVSAEAAQRILHEKGYTDAKFDLVRRFPTAPSMAEAERMAAAPVSRHWTDTADPDGPEMRALRAARDANPLIQAAREAAARRKEAEDAGE